MSLMGYDPDGAVVAELIEENGRLKKKITALNEKIKTLEKLIGILRRKVRDK